GDWPVGLTGRCPIPPSERSGRRAASSGLLHFGFPRAVPSTSQETLPSMRRYRTHAPGRRPKRRVASFLVGGVATALSVGWVSGCSVLYDLSTEQCSSDADCVALGGVFESLVCINNLCQEPIVTGCQSNAQCMDEEGNGIEPYACIDRECVRLTTAECPTMLPQTGELWRENLRSDNPVILAGTGIIDGTTFIDPILLNYDLALTELTQKMTTLPSGRRVVMIGCKALFE